MKLFLASIYGAFPTSISLVSSPLPFSEHSNEPSFLRLTRLTEVSKDRWKNDYCTLSKKLFLWKLEENIINSKFLNNHKNAGNENAYKSPGSPV
ncbi:hypothetical protein V6N13_095000 [Hibiscus sabdariffa]|uniref:Uncharacterized protein n=1 Tax=Hibiscus sabdariffa TaxID=183260 RepID=A0ABR2PSZ9_9ROSI